MNFTDNNHSDSPNADFCFDVAETAREPILEGDEVLIDYRSTHPQGVRGF